MAPIFRINKRMENNTPDDALLSMPEDWQKPTVLIINEPDLPTFYGFGVGNTVVINQAAIQRLEKLLKSELPAGHPLREQSLTDIVIANETQHSLISHLLTSGGKPKLARFYSNSISDKKFDNNNKEFDKFFGNLSTTAKEAMRELGVVDAASLMELVAFRLANESLSDDASLRTGGLYSALLMGYLASSSLARLGVREEYAGTNASFDKAIQEATGMSTREIKAKLSPIYEEALAKRETAGIPGDLAKYDASMAAAAKFIGQLPEEQREALFSAFKSKIRPIGNAFIQQYNSVNSERPPLAERRSFLGFELAVTPR